MARRWGVTRRRCARSSSAMSGPLIGRRPVAHPPAPRPPAQGIPDGCGGPARRASRPDPRMPPRFQHRQELLLHEILSYLMRIALVGHHLARLVSAFTARVRSTTRYLGRRLANRDRAAALVAAPDPRAGWSSPEVT